MFNEFTFHATLGIAICENIIHDAFLSFVSFVHGGVFLLCEDAAVIFAIHLVVAYMVNDDGSFLFHDKTGHLTDELLRIQLVEIELLGTYL